MPNRLALLLLATLFTAAALGACGQRGPLYLPDQNESESAE